ncbi:MAG: TfoX/Sxy family protein [Bacteroides sp.]|nr:TfoX/Sxy family protein [Bacillota bacterium]MCM1455372.1 TfoX/Sxy family protein [Bacteroides sp.]
MATSVDYIEFVCEQIHGDFAVRYKKMFGEYMVYLNDKPVLLVCDNTVYVKKLAELSELMRDAECGIPYDGSKEHYVLDIENAELTEKVLKILESVTPLPKKRR